MKALHKFETQSLFSVYGRLNNGNVAIFRRLSKNYIFPGKNLILNLGWIKEIDKTGSYSSPNLFTAGKRSHSLLALIGFGNTKVTNVTAIIKLFNTLDHDRN